MCTRLVDAVTYTITRQVDNQDYGDTFTNEVKLMNTTTVFLSLRVYFFKEIQLLNLIVLMNITIVKSLVLGFSVAFNNFFRKYYLIGENSNINPILTCLVGSWNYNTNVL